MRRAVINIYVASVDDSAKGLPDEYEVRKQLLSSACTEYMRKSNSGAVLLLRAFPQAIQHSFR